jgi:hypothetical protein
VCFLIIDTKSISRLYTGPVYDRGMTDKLATDPIDEILRLHQKVNGRVQEAVGQAFQKSIGDVIRIGELLTARKEALPHGEFGPWCEENLPFSQKSVSNYMRVYAQRDDPKLVTVTNLTDAYKLLTPKPKKRVLKPPEPEVIDTEGEEVAPEPAETLPDTSGMEEEEDESTLPETSGDPLADIRNGLGAAPLNATSPKEVAVNTRADLEESVVETSRDPLEPPEGLQRPEFIPVGKTAPEAPSEPEEEPLPADWIIILTEVRMTSVPEVKVTEALQTLLKKAQEKYP